MDADQEKSSKEVAARTLVLAGFVFATAILGARLTIQSIWSEVVDSDRLWNPYGRMFMMAEAMPTIATQDGAAVAMGVCHTEKGFQPQEFDEVLSSQGSDVKTYSLGVHSLSSDTQLVLARRLRQEVEGQGNRLSVAMIEFNVTTRRSEDSVEMWAGKGFYRRLKSVLYNDWQSIAGVVSEDKHWAAQLAAHKILGGNTDILTVRLSCYLGLSDYVGCSVRQPSWWTWGRWRDAKQRKRFEDEMAQVQQYDRMRSVLRERYGDGALAWTHEEGGFIRRRISENPEVYDTYMEKEDREFFAHAYRGGNHDAIGEGNLNIREMDVFLEAVNELSKFADTVVVFTTPQYGLVIDDEIDPIAKLYDESLALIAKETTAKIIRFDNDESYTSEDFQNLMGLLGETRGGPRFSRELAERVAALKAGGEEPGQTEGSP